MPPRKKKLKIIHHWAPFAGQLWASGVHRLNVSSAEAPAGVGSVAKRAGKWGKRRRIICNWHHS